MHDFWDIKLLKHNGQSWKANVIAKDPWEAALGMAKQIWGPEVYIIVPGSLDVLGPDYDGSGGCYHHDKTKIPPILKEKDILIVKPNCLRFPEYREDYNGGHKKAH